MNNQLKNVLYLLSIVVAAEIAILLGIWHYFFSLPTYKSNDLSNSTWFVRIEPSLTIATDTPDLTSEVTLDLNEDNPQMLPIFTTGTSEEKILEALGEPMRRQKGYWANSIAWSYEDIVYDGMNFGYLFDQNTKKLRQTEIAAPPSTNLEILQNFLNGLLGDNTSEIAEQGLEDIYWRQKNQQTFNVGNLKGIIQRNAQDRIYIGVWEADFH